MSSKPSTSKDAVKAEEKPKFTSETLNVLEEDDEFEEFAAAGKFSSSIPFPLNLISLGLR
jgi:hypothetical protein